MTFLSALLALVSAAAPDVATTTWQTLAPGMEQTQVAAGGDAHITVLRFDPREWQLAFAGNGDGTESANQTARQWAQQRDFVAVINAGMFRRDYKTHIGFLKAGAHVSNDHANDYQSIAAFDATDNTLPAFRLFDLDSAGVSLAGILKDYASAAQNLRLIRRPGVNQWPQQERRWSEAALGEDSAGHILFLFCRSALSMHDFNDALLASGIGVVAAQHLEGGPEAQLYLHVGDVEHEWFGSYETSFRENDGNDAAWSIPNVFGVRRRQR